MAATTASASVAGSAWGSKIALTCACVATLVLLWFGWQGREARPISAEYGIGYALGILSVLCMLTLLVFPLRKRLKFLTFLGPIKDWFRRHQQLGMVATLLALFHCNFQVGSPNSQIALVSTLLIASSGLIGRFLYRRFNRQLNGRRTDLRSAKRALADERFPDNRLLRCLPLLKQRVQRFDDLVLDSSHTLRRSLATAWTIRRRARREQSVLMHFFRQQLTREGERQPLIDQHQDRLGWAMERYLYVHMQRVVMIAELQAFERIFSLWHIVHVTCFVLLIFSVTLHVIAVHVY
ncbi:MAG: hypothetical protein AAF648_04315 [Pseudomonadota bacterium]